jgi:hypothetical protein
VRGRQKLLCDADGRVVDAAVPPAAMAEPLRSASPPVGVTWGPLWWPLASPFVAWSVGVIGMVGLQGRAMVRHLRLLEDRRERR